MLHSCKGEASIPLKAAIKVSKPCRDSYGAFLREVGCMVPHPSALTVPWRRGTVLKDQNLVSSLCHPGDQEVNLVNSKDLGTALCWNWR